MESNLISANCFEKKITVEDVTVTFIGNALSEDAPTTDVKELPKLFHTHVYAELFLCKSGEMSVVCSSVNHKLSEGDVVFVPPKVPHYAEIGSDCVSFVIGISIKKRKQTENFNIYKNLQKLFDSETPVCFRSFRPVFPEKMLWIEEFCRSQSVSAMLSGISALSFLADSYVEQLPAEDTVNKASRKLNVIMQIENYIGGRYYENITAPQLAQMLYISPRQLARIVNERFGDSLHHVIILKRIESAAKLLSESKLTVEEISAFVGFDTKSCFYKAFKKEYGITPLQYRNKHKGRVSS